MTPKTESLEERIARVLRDKVEIVPYDPAWPGRFEEEKRFLLQTLPADIVRRIEHFGSTAVPGLEAKPVVDMLVEVASLEETKRRVVPALEALAPYEYFWRPTGVDSEPHYCWFIKRDFLGARTHHIHMVERGYPQWEALLFRDHLIAHPETAREYGELKRRLSKAHPGDRIAYTREKTAFITRVTALAHPPPRGLWSP